MSRAPSGSTIVLRRGAYHESIAIESKQLTIQNYPGEAAWMDGSSVVTGWAQSGNTWVKEGWTTRFDYSPTFFRGAPDYTAPGWNFVNPAYPMAAHPDQMWVDGVVQQQVDSLAKVAPGTFYLDEATSRLYLGTDPTNRLVRASDLAKALSVRGAGSVIRGLGIVRYAPSVWQIGAVSFERPGIVAEDLTVGGSATAGIGVTAANITLNRVTVDNNGLMGVLANEAYGLRMTRSRIVRNNDEHFNTSPAAGGMKITRSRGIVIQDSDFRDNLGTGIWFDESDYDIAVIGDNFVNNANHGTFLELSSTATVVDNVYLGNLNTGLQVNDTDRVQVWNNTFVGNGRAVNVVQDLRRASDTSAAGHDRARPLPDPTVSWVVKDVSIVNNVVAQPNARANCVVCVEDYSHVFSAEQMQVRLRTNIYNRTTGWPTWFAIWSRGPGNPAVYASLSAFQAASGQDGGSYSFDGVSEVD
ncbi:MAG: right-handed parallel beta-helix repeat-containing protein, partial [Actinomycetota bacterium]|nr:right-handed parallel beta-helix repeat-containing protein [Actinomycetota bacterium]